MEQSVNQGNQASATLAAPSDATALKGAFPQSDIGHHPKGPKSDTANMLQEQPRHNAGAQWHKVSYNTPGVLTSGLRHD